MLQVNRFLIMQTMNIHYHKFWGQYDIFYFFVYERRLHLFESRNCDTVIYYNINITVLLYILKYN